MNEANTGITLESSLNASDYGQSVTFTTTVTASSPGEGTPTGSIIFYDGSTAVDTETLDGSGDAAFTTSTLSVGSHTITAVYGGDGNYDSSTSSDVNQTVNQAGSTTELTSSENPAIYGDLVTFIAEVSGPGVAPTGTITFYDGSTAVDTETLDSCGDAAFTTNDLGVTSHTITAVYSGDDNYYGSTSSAVTESVDLADPTVSLTSSALTSLSGSSVTFTTEISSNIARPTGSVTFFDGGTELGTETLNTHGFASFSTSDLDLGSHTISAVYSGDDNFNTITSGDLTQVVTNTTTSLTSSAISSVSGDSLTLTATVSSGAGTPTGTVTFYDGSTLVDSETLDGSGVATFTTSSLSIGNHSITAVYAGDGTYTSSTSSVVNQAIDATSTIFWIGSGYWDNPANWSTDTVPTSTDNVVFDGNYSNGDADFNISSDANAANSITLSSSYNGTLHVLDPMSIGTGGLELDGGNIDQPNGSSSNITDTGGFNWSGGILNSSSTLSTFYMVGFLADVNIKGGAKTQGSTLDVTGDVVNLNSTGNWKFNNDAGINLNAGSSFNWNSADANIVTTGTGFITNTGGTFTKPELAKDVKCDLPYVNNGADAVLKIAAGGKLTFTRAGATNDVSVFQSQGVIRLASGADLQVDKGLTMSGGELKVEAGGSAWIKGGTVEIHGGVVDLTDVKRLASGGIALARLDIAGAVTMDGGTFKTTVNAANSAAGYITAKSFLIGGTAAIQSRTINIPPLGGVPRNNLIIVLHIDARSTGTISGNFATENLPFMDRSGRSFRTWTSDNQKNLFLRS